LPFTSAESSFIFRYKPPLGVSSPFTSAVFALTFRASPFTSAESSFIFCCKLCIPFGTTFEQKLTLHSLRNDFLLFQKTYDVFLRTTFYYFGKTCNVIVNPAFF
jgi:hypothetical protein